MSTDEKYLHEIGAVKLSQSPSGRKYLEGLRKKHEIDCLQPSDPRFRKVYGEPKKII